MTIETNYRPQLFDYVKESPYYVNRPIERVLEFFGSWYFGGRVYKVVHLNQNNYNKIYLDSPHAHYFAIFCNIIRLALFPLTVIGVIYKAYFRNLERIAAQPPDGPARSSGSSTSSASNLDAVPNGWDPFEDDAQMDEPVIQLGPYLYNLLDIENGPSGSCLDTAKATIKIVDDYQLPLEDTTAYDILKTLVAQNEKDVTLLVPTLQTLANQIEAGFIKRKDDEEKQKTVAKFTSEIEDCKQAWKTAKQLGIDCSMLLDGDMAFIGKLTCFFMARRLLREKKSINENTKARLGASFYKDLEIASKCSTQVFFGRLMSENDEKDLLSLFVYDLCNETEHEISGPDKSVKKLRKEVNEKFYTCLKEKITSLFGVLFSTMRKEWLPVLQKGMMEA